MTNTLFVGITGLGRFFPSLTLVMRAVEIRAPREINAVLVPANVERDAPQRFRVDPLEVQIRERIPIGFFGAHESKFTLINNNVQERIVNK